MDRIDEIRYCMSVNREYKDSVFTALFKDKDKLLSLYNAITKSNLSPDTPVEFATLEDVLFTERRNDIAFVLDNKIVILIEHQSSINENMPLRLLIYVARVYEKLIDNDAVYMRKLLKIPKPDFIVLYNGTDPFPEEKTLKLSEAYKENPKELSGLSGSLELEVRVLNVNAGYNEAIIRRSEALYGYVRFIGKIRDNQKRGLDLTAAITQAVSDCIKEGVIAEFLNSHSSEVLNMLTTEWNIERAKEIWIQEAREEGWEKGREEGQKKGLKEGQKKGREEGREEGRKEGETSKAVTIAKSLLKKQMPIDEIMEVTGLTSKEVEALSNS